MKMVYGKQKILKDRLQLTYCLKISPEKFDLNCIICLEGKIEMKQHFLVSIRPNLCYLFSVNRF